MIKTYKFRLYPNNNQKDLIEKHIGSSRFVFNFFLSFQSNCYKNTKTYTNKYTWSKVLTKIKKTEKYNWLNDVNSQSLQDTLSNLDNQYKRFFKKKGGYPNFKSKHKVTWSFGIPQNLKLEVSEHNIKYGNLYIPKFIKYPIKTRMDRLLPYDCKIQRGTITKTRTNKYYVSVVVECESIQKPKNTNPTNPDGIGIDVGIKDTLVLSNGEKYNLPINSKQYDKKIRRLQKSLSRKYKKGQPLSKNFEKTRIRTQKVYEKIKNIKDNWIHQITNKLITENQGDYFFLETLNIQGMSKNRKLSKAITFQSWYKFKEILSYKSKWNNKKVITIGQFEPTTKLCSKCGYKNKGITLDQRQWECPECKTKHDRDINQQENIKEIGLIQYVLSKQNTTTGTVGSQALGERVRRVSTIAVFDE